VKDVMTPKSTAKQIEDMSFGDLTTKVLDSMQDDKKVSTSPTLDSNKPVCAVLTRLVTILWLGG